MPHVKRLVFLVAVLLLLLTAAPLRAEEEAVPFAPDILEPDLRRHLAYLSSDAMAGRESLSAEGRLAAEYIARQFETAGLLPKGTEGYFQPYVIQEPVLEKGNRLEVTVGGTTTTWAVEKDWNPFSISKAATVTGEVVFAGYGIRAPGRQWDDYAGVDVKGKIVVLFRKNPGWRERQHAGFLRKLSVAAKQGAAGVLLCNDPTTTRQAGRDQIGHWSASVGAPAGSGAIPYAFISQAVASQLLAPLTEDLAGLEAKLLKEGPQSAVIPDASVTLCTALTTTKNANTRNVVGFLVGTDPELANEIVVVGAHYDHVGLGLYGSTGGREAAGKIHNGADDNGSGTVSLLEQAAWFAQPSNRTRRSMLFIAFSGEERGLLGSSHFVNKPTVPLADITAMLNMDMVGRSRDGRMQIGGVGTAEGLQALVAAENETVGMKVDWDQQGTAPSDSTSFFRKRIPVLFFFTGLHKDYHRPTDDLEHINFEDMLRINGLVRGVATRIANRDEALRFTMPPRPPPPPILGVRPSPEPDAQGIAILSVTPNGPAAQAGMQDGDVIVEIGGRPTKDLGALRQVLGRLTAGKTVPVVVLRGEERVRLRVTLGERPQARGR
jgi:hypothetical protein